MDYPAFTECPVGSETQQTEEDDLLSGDLDGLKDVIDQSRETLDQETQQKLSPVANLLESRRELVELRTGVAVEHVGPDAAARAGCIINDIRRRHGLPVIRYAYAPEDFASVAGRKVRWQASMEAGILATLGDIGRRIIDAIKAAGRIVIDFIMRIFRSRDKMNGRCDDLLKRAEQQEKKQQANPARKEAEPAKPAQASKAHTDKGADPAKKAPQEKAPQSPAAPEFKPAMPIELNAQTWLRRNGEVIVPTDISAMYIASVSAIQILLKPYGTRRNEIDDYHDRIASLAEACLSGDEEQMSDILGSASTTWISFSGKKRALSEVTQETTSTASLLGDVYLVSTSPKDDLTVQESLAALTSYQVKAVPSDPLKGSQFKIAPLKTSECVQLLRIIQDAHAQAKDGISGQELSRSVEKMIADLTGEVQAHLNDPDQQIDPKAFNLCMGAFRLFQVHYGMLRSEVELWRMRAENQITDYVQKSLDQDL